MLLNESHETSRLAMHIVVTISGRLEFFMAQTEHKRMVQLRSSLSIFLSFYLGIFSHAKTLLCDRSEGLTKIGVPESS